MKKKKILFTLVALLIFIFPLVSAQAPDFETVRMGVEEGLDRFGELAKPIFGKIVGDYESTDFLFSEALLLILLIVITKNVLEKTPLGEDRSKISSILAIIVSILAIRFIHQNEIVEAILIPYGTMGVAITTILPIVIFFYFIHNINLGTFGRKLAWAFFGAVLIGIWLSKSSELSETSNWIYGASMMAVVILIWQDKSIHSYLESSDFDKMEKERIRQELDKVQYELADLRKMHGHIPEERYNKRRKDYLERARKLRKELSK